LGLFYKKDINVLFIFQNIIKYEILQIKYPKFWGKKIVFWHNKKKS